MLFRNLLSLILSAVMLFGTAPVSTDSLDLAEEYTAQITVTTGKRKITKRVTDNNISSWQPIKNNAELNSEHEFTQLYIIWHDAPGEYTVSYGDAILVCGKNGFLHELVTFPKPVSSISLNCDGAWLCDVRVFSEGTLPDDVQVWEASEEKADVLAFPTHADDECLFLGAFIADAVNRGLSVQLAFLTVHGVGEHGGSFWNREHERLNGMWEMGLTRYPCFGGFNDYNGDYYNAVAQKFGPDKVEAWQVETIRRYRPEIIISHDLNGEYGHNAHKLNARCLTDAIFAAADCERYPESFEQFGVWQARKLYVHLSKGDPFDLEVNYPLDAFGGRTAFEVAKSAYRWHKSQHIWSSFQVRQNDKVYNCRLFGLAYSSVGKDTGNDYLEHLTAYDGLAMPYPFSQNSSTLFTISHTHS